MPHCKDCDVRFDKITSYLSHRRNEHSRFPCLDCGKVFGIRKKLVCHLRGCRENRRNTKIRQESGAIISFSNYKRLPIVTAKELDTEFEIYMNRKFGKKGIFRNEKMCKFCCETFVMASDFADHIRDHYKSIPLDATCVKSKFDFMHFMGLKIRETNDTDCSNTEAVDKPKNKMAECKVVIIGERCKICCESFKCSTDLDKHNKIHHPQKKRNETILVLKIGKEIISRIPLKKRHIRRSAKTAYRSNCKRLRIRSDEIYDTWKYSSSVEREGETKSVGPNGGPNRTNNAGKDFEVVEGEDTAQSKVPSEKERGRAFCLQNEINQSDGNMTRCRQDARGSKEIVDQYGLGSADEAENDCDSVKSCYATKIEDFELESGGIYADEYLLDNIQFSEPWKDEFTGENECWYSEMNLKDDDLASDEDSCYCLGSIEPRLTPKERNDWEQEHYNDTMKHEETGSCQELTFHESPPIYKYSSDSKYQADFSFPSDEKSYGIQVEHGDNEETNNNGEDDNHNINGSCVFGYKAAITVKDDGKNWTVNHSRSVTYQCEDKSFGFENLGSVTAAGNAVDKYQEVLIKEEVMLEDFTCCVNDVYPPSSHLSA